MKRIFRKIWPLFFFLKGLNMLRLFGYAETRLWGIVFLLDKGYFSKNVTAPLLTRKQKRLERSYSFKHELKFSILAPICDPSVITLHNMIRSAMNQTYANWELCISDTSVDPYGLLQKTAQKYAKADKRIKYTKQSQNISLSESANKAIELAAGDYLTLLNQNDLLHPSALYEVAAELSKCDTDFIYTDEISFHTSPYDAFSPLYKPKFSPDSLRSGNYIGNLSLFKSSLISKVGLYRSEFDGSHEYDMTLRLTEQVKAITHIPRVLYYRRTGGRFICPEGETASTAQKTDEPSPCPVAEHLERVGLRGEVLDTEIPNIYRIKYEITGNPLISILIPNKDHVNDLEKCISSIFSLSTYSNFEVLIIENNSEEDETFLYYEKLKENEKVKIITWSGEFNYSAINNFGVKHAKGEYLLLLNNDIEVITPDWLSEMLSFAQRQDVGAVGAMLYYPDDTVQHAGVILGLGGAAAHSHKHFKRSDRGYMNRLCYAQNLTAVTAACLMISTELFTQIGGFDEKIAVAFNDTDFCMRIRKAGYLIVFTPFAKLYHHESKTRGAEDTPEKEERFEGEVQRFRHAWKKELDEGDPYYNPNLTMDREDFSFNG